MVPSFLVGGQKAEVPTGYGFVNSAGTGSLLADANGWTFTGLITGVDIDITGSLDLAITATAADQVLNTDLSMNHATAIGVGVDATAVQLTTARTGGYMAAFRSATTSLAGDLNSVKYYDYLAGTPTDGGGAALHVAFAVLSGHDRLIDCTDSATGTNDIAVPSNVADAINFTNGTLTYWTLKTTTASPGIVETWAHTGTAAGHSLTATINHATQVDVGFDADISQLTTARTAGYVAAYRAHTTSLAGDLNGVIYAGLYCAVPTDGGGAAIHVGLYDAGNDYAVIGADNVKVGFGTGASGVPDISFVWDATDLVVSQLTANSAVKWGVDGAGLDQVWYGDTASANLTWDQSADALVFNGAASIRGQRNSTTSATIINAATVLTLADAGGIFTVNQGTAYDIDLPSPTSGAGCRYMFQLVSPGANAVTITVLGGAATFEGVIVNDVTSVIPATGNTLTFASGTAALGDCIEVISTATNKYFVRAITSAAGGITIA